jgi:hypothetical protein
MPGSIHCLLPMCVSIQLRSGSVVASFAREDETTPAERFWWNMFLGESAVRDVLPDKSLDTNRADIVRRSTRTLCLLDDAWCVLLEGSSATIEPEEFCLETDGQGSSLYFRFFGTPRVEYS